MLSLEFMYTKYQMFLILQTRQVCIYRKKTAMLALFNITHSHHYTIENTGIEIL